ncbi:MAG: hypothetical protein ACXVA9_02745 [Bdellovibrionales bacterium]
MPSTANAIKAYKTKSGLENPHQIDITVGLGSGSDQSSRARKNFLETLAETIQREKVMFHYK